MKKNISLVALAVMSCFQVVSAQSTASKLVVNEIMASNIDMIFYIQSPHIYYINLLCFLLLLIFLFVFYSNIISLCIHPKINISALMLFLNNPNPFKIQLKVWIHQFYKSLNHKIENMFFFNPPKQIDSNGESFWFSWWCCISDKRFYPIL